MGWIVWLLLSSLALVASWLVAAAVYPDRSTADRATAMFIVAPSLVLTAMQSVGLFDRLSPVPLGFASLVIFGTAAAASVRHLGRAKLREIFALDLRAPVRLARDVVATRELAVLLLVPALIALGINLAMIWYFKSWTWDPAWYHVPITSYAIQNHSIGMMPSVAPGAPAITGAQGFAVTSYLEGYPRNVELLAAWNCIFQRDNRLDDSSQIPFVLLGFALAAAWARRLGASRAMAVSAGAAWFLLPPVFLQAHSTHVDIACGTLFAAAVFYSSEKPRPRDRWMAFLAIGLYIGTKFSGAFHLAMLAPWFAARIAYELGHARGKRLARLGEVALSTAAFAVVGAHKYIQNLVVAKNPLWPFHTKVGSRLDFAGPQEVGDFYGAPHGVSPSFFGIPGDFDKLMRSWFDPHPFFAPDVRSGGFGPAFRWLLLPCVLIVLADVVRLREWKRGLPIVALFAMAIVVPAAWWPRYTMAIATASVMAFVMVHRSAPNRWYRYALSLALVALVYNGYAAAKAGFIAYPKHFEWAVRTPAEDRSALQLDTFLWPTEWGMRREHELRAGDVVTYDESAQFLGEFFTHDYRTRVVFVSSSPPNTFVDRLRPLHPRWVGVRHGSAAEQSLHRAGATYLFSAPTSDIALWRMPAGF